MADLCLSLRKPLACGARRRLTRAECEAIKNLGTAMRPHTGPNWLLRRACDAALSLYWRDRDGTAVTWALREAPGVPAGLASFEPVLRTDSTTAVLHVTAKVKGARYFAQIELRRKEDGAWTTVLGAHYETFTGKPVRGAANVRLEELVETAKQASIQWANGVERGRCATDIVVRLQPTESEAYGGWIVRMREAFPQGRVTTRPHGTFKREEVLIKDDAGETLLLAQGHGRAISTVVMRPTAGQLAIIDALRRIGMLVE